jgi:uncharacterized protein DUF6933
VIFRCTEKVRKRLRLAPSLLAEVPGAAAATEWHCNLLHLARRPAYLVTHSLSLFTALFPAAGISSPADLADAVRRHAREALGRHGFAPEAIRRVVDEGPDEFCKNTDRRVLGSMNDFAQLADWSAYQHQSADAALLAWAAEQQMNPAPMGLLGMKAPRDVMRLLLEPRGTA